MKQLLRKPFLLSLLLSLPLWVVFKNYIVAICAGLLIAFLLSMLDSIIVIQRQQKHSEAPRSGSDTSTDSSASDKQ